MTFVEFLNYVGTSAGINAAVGFVISFLAEWWPSFEALEPKAKRLVMMVLCFVIPLAALLARVALGEMLTVDSVWACVLAGFSAFFGSQAAHVRELD